MQHGTIMVAEYLVAVAALIVFTSLIFWCLHRKSAINWTSPEAVVFRNHYPELKAAIQSPEIVADELFARGSIDSGIKEKVHLHTRTRSENCEILLDAIGQKISVDPGEFHVLVSVLQTEPATKKFADRLFRVCHNHNVASVGRSSHKGTHRSIADTETDKEHRKLASQQQFRLFPEKGQKLTDSKKICSLPIYIRVMVSKYQPLETIFAIDKSECHTRERSKDEQFSPIVTIVDTETQQPLDCVLLLHGEKLPEVECRTLFCHIAVQVSYCDTDGSNLYPLYHVESKPCKEGKLPLIFHFHQPGTVCVIRLSIHCIADSEGIEYMYHSEDCDCIVQIVDRDKHQGVKNRDQHGVVRMKQPPRLTYTGPLATEQYHTIAQCFETFYSPYTYNCEKIINLAKRIVEGRHIGIDLKVFALCWEASSEICLCGNNKGGEKLLRTAWEKTLECKNSLLLQAMIHRIFAVMYYSTHEFNKALEHMEAAKTISCHAACSREAALVLYRETVMKWRELVAQRDISTDKCKSTEENFEKLLACADYVEDYEKPYIFLFCMEKAKFHLRTLLISDELPLEKYKPSQDDLRKAEKCLKRVSMNELPSVNNFYVVPYYEAHCDLCLWRGQYSEAIEHLKNAKLFYGHENCETDTTRRFNERFKLLEELKTNTQKAQEQKIKEEEEIEKIVKEFSSTLPG